MMGRSNYRSWPKLCCVVALLTPAPQAAAAKPLMLHPANPHYFLFRDKPAVLVTSGEHYGAVLNREFDYIAYLDELQNRGFNLTRTFCGTYREVPGSFGITDNTLAPKPNRYLAPWARSATPGAADGGNKFDSKAWDNAYFQRLKDFMAQAGRRGIVVELGLFCTVYDDKLWAVNAMNAANNVDGIGTVGRLDIYTLKDKALTAVQEALVRKIVAELKDYDNLYYEVCNEPYFGGVSREWTDHMVATISDAEAGMPTRHLIAQNIANGSTKISPANPRVSVFNFHYSTPPDSVALNADLRRVIADDETGFRGQTDLPYRSEGWEFLMAGGAVYSNLDYSYTCPHPDGTARVTTSPGGGGPELRKQLAILKRFIEELDFIKMRPDNGFIKSGQVSVTFAGNPPEGRVTARGLVDSGRTYAVYLRGGTKAELTLSMPTAPYQAEWLNTKTGKIDKQEIFDHGGGEKVLAGPTYADDIALRVRRRAGKR
jgi:hypothetical protein